MMSYSELELPGLLVIVFYRELLDPRWPNKGICQDLSTSLAIGDPILYINDTVRIFVTSWIQNLLEDLDPRWP